MYLKMFNLKEKPFHITPNPRFIFLSKNHKEAFAHLLYGVRQRVGFLSLIGEVGTGKTTVLRTLLHQLEQSDYQVALIFNPCLSALELLQAIHREFNIPCREDGKNLASLHDSLNRFLLEQRQQGRTVVLVIDEAQNLDPAVLEQLRLLSNLETETDKLLQLIIVGQPELEEILERHELRQLKQRLTVRYRLSNMDAEDTAAYVQHRLKVAGLSGQQLFTRKSLQRVYRLTKGLPRLINILCDRALLVAYAHELNRVDHKTVAEAQAELVSDVAPKATHWWLMATLSCVSVAIALLLYLQPELFPGIFNRYQQIFRSSSAAPVVTKKVKPLEVQPTIIDPQLLAQIKRKIGSFNEANSAKLAASAVLRRWGRHKIDRLDLQLSHPLESALRTEGMSLIHFYGNRDKLLQFDTPAILPIILPNLPGKRYLALLQLEKGQILTIPSLTDDGWLPLQYLNEVWFGGALIPWNNYKQLPYLTNPGKRVAGTSLTQKILSLAGYPHLKISGVFDAATIAAASDLQRRTGLAPDGRIGAQTLLQIYRLAGHKMPRLKMEVTQ